MARDRTIYNSLAIYAGPSPATGYHTSSANTGDNLVVQLHRATSANWGFDATRTPINIFGKLAHISRAITDPPTVNFDATWYDINARNESGLGMTVDNTVSAFSGIINGTQDDRNYFLLLAPDEEDAIGNASADSEFYCVGIGNGFLSNYAARGSVGGFAENSITVEGLNFKVDANRTGNTIPAINPAAGTDITNVTYGLTIPTTGLGTDVLRHGDMSVSITTSANSQTGIGVSLSDWKLQNYEVTANLSRTPLEKIGSKFPFARKINFPADVGMRFTADMGDMATGNLSQLLCNDNKYNITITLKQPGCGGSGPVAKIYRLVDAQLDSESFSSSVGPNVSVDLGFSTQIAEASDVTVGLFISGLVE